MKFNIELEDQLIDIIFKALDIAVKSGGLQNARACLATHDVIQQQCNAQLKAANQPAEARQEKPAPKGKK